jgi:Cys-tRNA(Pro)/Cys-tRNA(Cys) deacylase
MKKTNAIRILDDNNIKYELREYEVDEEDLSAENIASKVGIDVKNTVKTLVLKGDKTGILVCCLQGHQEINLKALAAASGNKKHELLTRIQKITNMKTQHTNQKPRLLALAGILAIGLSFAWIIPADTTKIKNQVDSTRKAQKTLRQLPVPPVPPLAAPRPPAIPEKVKSDSLPVPPEPMHLKMVAPPALPAPPAPVDTNKIKKQFNSAEWKAQKEA